MAYLCGEYRLLQGIHVRFDTRIESPYSVRPKSTKFGKQLHVQDLTEMIYINKHYISNIKVLIATKIGRMIAYFDGILPKESHHFLIKWCCKMT